METLQTPARFEVLARYAVGFLLWACSAYLTVFLFLSMAGPRLGARLFMIVLALAIESTKLLTWRMGHTARYLAYALIALSAVASFGAALKTVQGAQSSFLISSTKEVKASREYEGLAQEQVTIDREIALSLDRFEKLPPEYTTAATRLSGTLVVLRDRRATIEGKLTVLESQARLSYDEENLFVLMGRALGLAPEMVLLVLLLFLSASIEAGALVLTAPLNRREARCPEDKGRGQINVPGNRTSQAHPIGKEEFLKAASEGADLPYLHGRDATARRLGISSYEAKRFVRALCAEGRIIAEGKRLRLTDKMP
jgi:hypothetical protein